MEIVLATNNPHKKREISQILSNHSIVIPAELGVNFEFDEKGATYLENCVGKGFALFATVGETVIADDSGLSVPALGGAPGVYSARYGAESRTAMDDVDRYELLLENMRGVRDRRAFYVCCMVLIVEEYRYFVCQETLHGEIADGPAGTGGFGYDPIFMLPEIGKTVAEISAEEKNRVSHRGRAGRRIGEIIRALATDGSLGQRA